MIYHTTRGDYGDPYDLDDLAETVDRAVQDIKPHLSDFDSIVVTGMSGVIVGVPVSLALGVPLVVLRKVSDDTHAFQRTINEGRLGERALFLDDFVSGGTTRTHVKQFVTAQGATLVADYLYRDREYETTEQRAQRGAEWAKASDGLTISETQWPVGPFS